MPKLNRPPRVYLSPAYHWFNNCSIAGCDETTHNNLYLDEVEPFLDACGIEWKRGPRRVPKSNESANALMKQAVRESDEFGADLHYVSHTNASVDDVEDIGKGQAKGYRPIIYKGSARGEELAEYMVARRRAVYPGKITLNRRSDLYELRVPKAVSYYEEHVFHDNMEDAEWFHAHMKDVARSAVQGMCDYFEIPFVEPEGGAATPAPKPTEEKKDTGNTCTVTLPVLSYGSTGEAVKALQMLLNGRGHNCGKVDGSFGPATHDAVKSFQEAEKIDVDGSVGPDTWTHLVTS